METGSLSHVLVRDDIPIHLEETGFFFYKSSGIISLNGDRFAQFMAEKEEPSFFHDPLFLIPHSDELELFRRSRVRWARKKAQSCDGLLFFVGKVSVRS